MSVVNSHEKFANEIGRDYGNTDNVVQAALLNGFAHGLQLGLTRLETERQIAYIVDKLDEKAKDMFRAFVGMIDLENEGF